MIERDWRCAATVRALQLPLEGQELQQLGHSSGGTHSHPVPEKVRCDNLNNKINACRVLQAYRIPFCVCTIIIFKVALHLTMLEYYPQVSKTHSIIKQE